MDALTVLHTNFHRRGGGQPNRILFKCRELQRMGYRPVIACPYGSRLAKRAIAHGVQTFTDVQFRPARHLGSLFRDARALKGVINREGVRILHAHGSQDLWACALAKARYGLPQPLIFTRHNTKPVRSHLLNRWLYRRVDRLILVSGGVRKRYAPLLARGVLEERQLYEIHSAYDVDRFTGDLDRTACKRALGFSEEDRLVGLIGRLDRDKGHRVLLDAAPAVLAAVPDARFLFVGEGDQQALLEAQVRRRGLGERVRFLGFREDMPEVTAALDVSVLPALGTDASSAVLKEAGAQGVPVVAADIGGAREIVADGETGFIVPPGAADALAAAVVRVLRDPDLASRLGAAARERVRQFTPRRLAECTLAVYADVLADWRQRILEATEPG